MSPVTPTELWRAVATALLEARTEKGWNLKDIQTRGGPDANTVKAIDQGRNCTTESLTRYAQAMSLSLVDVFRKVLARESEPLSLEAEHLRRIYGRLSVKRRRVLVDLAEALDEPSAELQEPDR